MNAVKQKSSASWSITLIFGLIILFMGAVGLALALMTGGLYRNLTLESQQQSLHELLRLKTDNQLQKLRLDTRQFAGQILSRDKFRRAIQNRNDASLQKQLDKTFKQHGTSQTRIKLLAISIYNQSFTNRAETRLSEYTKLPYLTCPGLLSRARQRRGLHSLRVIDELCLEQGQLLYTMLVPVGGYRLSGYLVMVVDPVAALQPIGESMQLPFNLSLHDSSEVLYRSPDWPAEEAQKIEAKVIQHSVTATSGHTLLHISLFNQPKGLMQQLSETRWFVMAVAGAVTVGAMLIALWILQRTTIHPLRRLTEQLQRIKGNRSEIGRHVVHSATREIADLTQGFNSMTTELNEMYGKLEDLAFTDALTRLPNRYQLHQCLEGVTDLNRNPERYFSFFLMDLDRFKTVNDTLGHHIGDQLLQQVGTRLQRVLRSTDTVTRLDQASRAVFENDMVARLGGDEFAAILPDAKTEQQAITVAKKIIHAMEETFSVDTHRFSIGISIGIVLFPQHDTDQHMLMRKADVAMYYAKKNHLGYVVYDPQQESDLQIQQSAG